MKINFIFTLVFSFMMSFLLSAWVTYVNLGLSGIFLHNWLIAFLYAWPAAFLVAFTVAPPIRSMVIKCINKDSI